MKYSLLPLGLLYTACIDVPSTDKDTDPIEEPSSEPAGEPSDSTGGSSGSSEGSDGSDGSGSDSTDGDGWGDGSSDGSGDGDSDSAGGTLNPDVLLFSFQNGYSGGSVTSVNFGSEDSEFTGTFSLYLYDTMQEDFCAVDWIFDSSTVAPDPDYADGFVLDGFQETDIEVWYGFLVLAPPQTRESCDNLTSDWLSTLDQIKADRPGFGYGPLIQNLAEAVESYYPAEWDAISETAFTSIPSMTVFSDGSRMYFPTNVGYAYAVDSNGTTTFDPNSQEFPQGSEINLSELPGDAFYVGNYFFGIGIGDH